MGHKIYLASSWRNPYQPEVLALLRKWGHEVYDFRNPRPGDTGFHWSDLDAQWESWDVVQYRSALWNPIAEEGFGLDMEALEWAEVVVLLLPCGASAHSEAAWGKGQGKPVVVHIPERCQPELMYKMFNAITADDLELFQCLQLTIGQLGKARLTDG